jgi:thymidylate kinase
VVIRLAAELDAAGIRYCQWKGRTKTARWGRGDGDIDLLVDRTSVPAFSRVLHQLDFKLALAPGPQLVPGVVSYLAPDHELGRLIHVHAHAQLIIGRPWTRHFRLPIERVVLDSAVRRGVFRTPAPELELLLFVLRMTLEHRLRDLVNEAPTWLRRAREELDQLEGTVNIAAVGRMAATHLPEVGRDCIERCLRSLRLRCPPHLRPLARHELQWRLSAHARRPAAAALTQVLTGRFRNLLWRPERRRGTGKRLAAGGAVIALVGADGAGKSTCARALAEWLAPELAVRRAHLGRPPRSFTTLVVGALHKLATRARPGLRERLQALRHWCTARDRYRLYRRIRRFAGGGGIAICERYPIAENRSLVGPSAAQGWTPETDGTLLRLIRRAESSYYDRIAPPDLVLVLRVDPERAVVRKPEEPATYVHDRARTMWNVVWTRRDARVIDAGRALHEVLADLRADLWDAL